MAAQYRLTGMEVPVTGSDSVKWLNVSIPSSSSASVSAVSVTEDCCSCSIIGNPPTHYLIWKICKSQPDVLEVLEVVGNKEFPRTGLRIQFPDALFPFAYIQRDERNFGSGNPYLLYAVTVHGVAFVVKLRSVHSYASSCVFASTDIFEYNLQSDPQSGAITAVAACGECLTVGRSDGSACSFQLDSLDSSAPGFMWELRDDAGFGRLWGIISRSRIAAAVLDIRVTVVHQKKLIFVLYSDGVFRIWNLTNHNKLVTHSFNAAGSIFLKLWVGETDNARNIVPLAVLHKNSMDGDVEVISVHGLNLGVEDKMIFTLESEIGRITLEEGGLVDVKLTSDKVWILKEDRLLMQELFGKEAVALSYALQEALVADQLFQRSDHSSDDILWLSHTVLSSSKDQISPLISSIFLQRLLFPGVFHSSVLRSTLEYYNKHFTDSDFESFTAEGLKNEILSLIEHEVGSGSLVSYLQCWKTFCADYCSNWYKINPVCGLFVDSSTGAVGLIRKNMFSLCRMLEDIELLIYGSFDDSGYTSCSGVEFSDDKGERETLFALLHCINNVSQQFGKAASAVFYESLRNTPIISSEEVLPQILKVLETGYSPSIVASQVSDIGADSAWERKVSHHKNLRRFSMDMFLSLHALCTKATSWGKVFDVIQNYLRFLVPRKAVHKFDFQAFLNIKVSVAMPATSQIAKIMFESALDLLLLLNYMVNTSGQIQMSQDDVSRIELELVPLIEEIMTEWHIIHFLVTTPTESPALEDFSSQLASLHIDNSIDRISLNEKLGKCSFTLAYILFLSLRSCSGDQMHLSSRQLPDCCSTLNFVREFTSWIIWGRDGEESSLFFIHSIELAFIFLRHGQYNALEYILRLVDSYSRKQKVCESLQTTGSEWPRLLHLLGCCLIQQAQRGLHRTLKERKVSEAVRCFYRAASMQGAPEALQSLPREAGRACLGFTGCSSNASLWKLHYYQWAMQTFEQYNLSEAAYTFALAALEQVDEALHPKDGCSNPASGDESATVIKGRLWANVFKFTLDLDCYHDAYCAIISNPDEESMDICLRRFINVLLECGSVKILCDGQLPFIRLAEKVERELVWKAARSDVMAKPNPFRLVYAFEIHRHNWRKAARFIYLYATQLKTEAATKDHQQKSLALQERLNGISAAINALQLVHPAYAWIDASIEEPTYKKEQSPNKRSRIHLEEPADIDRQQNLQSHLGIEELENEYVLTSAEYLLSLAKVKWSSSGNKKPSAVLVDLLVESNLYDMAFTVILRFWKDSEFKKEIERVFAAMSLKCCPNGVAPSTYCNHRMQGFLLTSSQDMDANLPDLGPTVQQSKGTSQWETLETYLEKYKGYHPRLPIVVAETLLSSDPQIVLPLWLVQLFKGSRQESSFGMAGSESNPGSLFRLYVDYGRFAEAINLLLEYFESFAALRPSDVVRRKRPSAAWFPYTIIERLWCQLEESIRLGHMVDQSEKLKRLLQGALLKHLNLVKVISEDLKSSSA